MTHSHIIIGSAAQSEFILAGKAIFTIENTATATRLTYRVEELEPNVFDVRVFTGSDNSLKSSYTKIGEFRNGAFVPCAGIISLLPDLKAWAEDTNDTYVKGFADNMMKAYRYGWRLSDKQDKFLAKMLKKAGLKPAVIPATDLRTKSFVWLMATLAKGDLPASINFYHEGRCCKCARRLTVPASIMLHYGPDCAKVVGKFDTWKALNKSYPPKAA